MHDLLEAAIESQRLTEGFGKDALGQRRSQEDYLEAIRAQREDLEARMARYLSADQIASFEFRLDAVASISAAQTTEALRDEDHPALRLRPQWPEGGLTGPAVP